jgi:hypothetical protein
VWDPVRIILGIHIYSLMHVCGREWFGAVCQMSSTSSRRLNFSMFMQRQFAGEPLGSSRVELSPP